MTNQEQFDICRAAIAKYGAQAQMDMCIEEYAELINAIEKYRRGRNTKADVITEIADVAIMCRQMALMFGVDEVGKEIDRKLERLKERMKQ